MTTFCRVLLGTTRTNKQKHKQWEKLQSDLSRCLGKIPGSPLRLCNHETNKTNTQTDKSVAASITKRRLERPKKDKRPSLGFKDFCESSSQAFSRSLFSFRRFFCCCCCYWKKYPLKLRNRILELRNKPRTVNWLKSANEIFKFHRSVNLRWK